jgi:hypothetical protein
VTPAQTILTSPSTELAGCAAFHASHVPHAPHEPHTGDSCAAWAPARSAVRSAVGASSGRRSVGPGRGRLRTGSRRSPSDSRTRPAPDARLGVGARQLARHALHVLHVLREPHRGVSRKAWAPTTSSGDQTREVANDIMRALVLVDPPADRRHRPLRLPMRGMFGTSHTQGFRAAHGRRRPIQAIDSLIDGIAHGTMVARLNQRSPLTRSAFHGWHEWHEPHRGSVPSTDTGGEHIV